MNRVFPDERVIHVRGTRKTLTMQLSNVSVDQTEWQFTAGSLRVLWGAISNPASQPTPKKGAAER